MATYLGNPSLSTAVKDRVMTTFQQALQLYKVGRTEEVLQGCGLILQMDPQFDPAKKLLEKARNPMAPIDVDALIPASTGDAMAEAQEALRQRDFQRVINLTTEILTNDLMNEEARMLNDQAREKMEAAPFIDQFVRKFDQSIANGDVQTARQNLDKARSLDPDHPGIKRMEKGLAERMMAAPSPAPPPSNPAPPAGGFGFDAPSFIVDAPQNTGARPAAQAADFGFTFEEEKPAPDAGGFGGGFSFDAPAAPAPAAPKPPVPAPPAAPAAPASGGFSFEQPSSGGFSFDAPASGGGGFSFDSPAPAAPAAPPPAATPPTGGSFDFNSFHPSGPAAPAPAAPASPPANDFDFSTASFETSDEDRRRIDQYLTDGDRAANAGDYQQAIDLWSRIFLIDVTNEQASERIERAKGKRREIEQKADAVITAAVAAYDRHDYDTAREKFAEVLRIDPANTTAHDYLERMADTTAVAPAHEFLPPPAAKHDILDDDEMSGTYEAPPVTTPDSIPAAAAVKAAAAKAERKAAAQSAKRSSSMGIIATLVAVLVLAGAGYFAYTKFFAKPDYDPAATQALIAQATRLSGQGKYDQAITILQDVKPDDPQHDKAVLMIADLQRKKSQAAENIDGKPAAQFYADQINAGRAAFDAHDFDGAKKAFEQAMRVKALPPDVQPIYNTASQQVAKLDAAKSLFKERRFADALSNLEQLRTQDPQNLNIQRMIVDAHFNLGAAALQEERLPDATKEFDEVLKVDPADELAKRSKDLAARYNGQPKDLLFKIYVKYLPMRSST
jgi:tetratricopeptide (TPR) repeat protein